MIVDRGSLVVGRNTFRSGWNGVFIVLLLSTIYDPRPTLADGETGASFLHIPVGARPAALGSAYTALATDAYAPTWNPAGLGLVDSFQIAAQHLSYIQSTHYEYVSAAVPLPRARACTSEVWCGSSAVGGSIQYFGSGSMTGRNASGTPTGDYSSHYAAMQASYGRVFGERLSLGVSGKWINARLDDVYANALAMDVGSVYRIQERLRVAATLMNLGSRLTFISEADPLPLAFHLAGAWQPRHTWMLSSELVIPRGSPVSFHAGTEWTPVSLLALRMGFRTDRFSGLSPLSAFSMGAGLRAWGQEFSYAWVPYGGLGDAHYFSLVMRFGEAGEEKRNLIRYERRKAQTTRPPSSPPAQVPEYEQLMELMDENAPAANPAR